MARSRMIKPEFWDDEKLAKAASRDARLLFVGMWNYSDDYGVVKGNPSWLKNKIFPYDDDITSEMFKKWLNELESKKFIILFVISDELFYFIKNFPKHQTINKPSITRNPTPPVAVTEDYGSTTEQLPSEREVEVKGREVEVKENMVEAVRLSTLLADLIVINKPDYRELKNGTREKRITSWSADIEKMIRIDARAPADIETVIIWSQKDGFWFKNILSGETLRKKFDRLQMEMKKPNRTPADKHAGIEQWLQETYYATPRPT